MKIGITGATGQLGRLAIAALKQRVPAANIVALARDPNKAADLGVETRQADYTQPETLKAAFEGIDVLALISSSDFNDRVGQHRNAIAAAKAANVGRLIYTSILKADKSPLLIAADHKATEPLIHASGLAYTILRNPWYTENWTGALPAAVAAGAVIGSTGDGRVSPATRADLAEALAVVAATPGHENKTYELGCDTAFTLADLAAETSAQTGKQIPFNNLPEATYAGILTDIGLPSEMARIVADADALAADGWLLDESKTLSTLIGRPTTGLRDAVKAGLGQ